MTTTPLVPSRAVRHLVSGDIERALRVVRRRRGISAPVAYAASKLAVTHWCRRQAISAEWAGAGISLNVITPGPVSTPMLQSQLEGAAGSHIRSFPIPLHRYGNPEQLADWAVMMVSPAADFMTGSVVVVDGGTEALIRANDWPHNLPKRRLPKLFHEMYRAR